MSTKHPPLTTTLYSSGLFATGIGLLTGAIHHSDKPLVWPPMTALGAAMVFWSTSPLWYTRRARPKRSTFEHLKEFTPFKIKRVGEGPEGYYKAKFKERPARQFYFQDDELLSASVPESVLADVVRAGKRREMNARYGSRVNMLETSGGQHRRLKIHEAWSEQWFTKYRRNRILPETFKDCISILVITGYLEPPRSGKAGRLIDPRPSANQIVDGAKEWWIYLHTPSPATSRKRTFGFLPAFAS